MTLGTSPSLGIPVGQDPLVCRFMRGIHRLRPPKPKLFPAWEVSSVLRYLKTWGEAKHLPLKRLIQKTAFLVALVCFKRPSDLCNMHVKEGYWQLSMRGFTCQPLGYGKTEPHNVTPPLHIEPHLEDPQLCPVYHLVRLEKTYKNLRSETETKFWLSSKHPHGAVKVSTMYRWLVEVIRGSGALSGKAGDVRSVGSTTAIQAGLDLKRVLKAADWQRVSTLQKYYFKPQKLQALSGILRA